MSDISPKTTSYTCPSAPPEVGTALFGIVQEPGVVAYISPGIPTTPAMINELQARGIAVENRLRFAGPCMAERCIQWKNDRCSLVDALVADSRGGSVNLSGLPQCGIRATCRWFAQHGQAACASCANVIRKPASGYGGNAE